MALGKFTPKNVEDIQKQLTMFLAQLGASYGIDFTINDTKHSEVSLMLNIQGILNNDVAKRAIYLERKKTWNENCEDMGLLKSDFGLVVTIEGRTFSVTGLNVSKDVVYLTETTGDKKSFACSPLAFKRAKVKGEMNG